MGSRLLDDDEQEFAPDDPDAPAVLPRKPKASLLKKMAGDVPSTSVGSSLDNFISKANEGLLDVKENPPSRERDLEAKVAELEKMVAVAEARATKAEAARARAVAADPVMPIAPQSRGWGGIAVAFALGCGAMFAVSTFVLKKEPEKTASVPAPATSPTPSPTPAPPTPAPTVAPIDEQVVAAPTPAPAPTPEETPAPVVETKVAAKKTPKRVPKATPTGETPKPPEAAHSGSDELYNPF